ncbi:hypothetical protein DPEC_G00073210 [Dallia pectoralis]|uniref:Uncharacterized protein n=1 Tax=Dallia pectoralis TaxID=75939 RepID=A0ACC2H3F3_DALPE|nr:hypothetical protein DPEC_G00073210 [Dallia pectoralis]
MPMFKVANDLSACSYYITNAGLKQRLVMDNKLERVGQARPGPPSPEMSQSIWSLLEMWNVFISLNAYWQVMHSPQMMAIRIADAPATTPFQFHISMLLLSPQLKWQRWRKTQGWVRVRDSVV